MGILLSILMGVLVLVCAVTVIFILMQRPNADAGMGASLGGGAAESAFGGETANVLTRVTIKCIVIYFVLCFGLFLGFLYIKNDSVQAPAAPSLSNLNLPTAAIPADELPKAPETTPVAPATEPVAPAAE